MEVLSNFNIPFVTYRLKNYDHKYVINQRKIWKSMTKSAILMSQSPATIHSIKNNGALDRAL